MRDDFLSIYTKGRQYACGTLRGLVLFGHCDQISAVIAMVVSRDEQEERALYLDPRPPRWFVVITTWTDAILRYAVAHAKPCE